MAGKTCVACGDRFTGRSDAAYCSGACRQRARRDRGRANRDTIRGSRDGVATESSAPVHGAAAQAVIDSLNAEMKTCAELLGQPLKWSAAERAVLDLIAETYDRRADLQRRYDAASDDRAAVRFSAELRLLEQSAARLLKQVRTEPPTPRPPRSVKAARAAHTRWGREA